MNNYYQELLEVVSKNKLTFLPSNETLASSKELALMCWKNFDDNTNDEDYFDYVNWYQKGQWNISLASYKDDINFWQEAFSLRKKSLQYDLLLMEIFQNDFPEVAKFYLENDERLIELFTSSERQVFFDLIKDPQKNNLYKQLVLNKNITIVPEQLIKFEDDKIFLLELLRTQPSNYQFLKNKTDEDIAQLAIDEFSNIDYMPALIREKLFPQWLNKHISSINPYREFSNYTEEERKQIFRLKPDYLAMQLDENFDLYKTLAVDYIVDTFDTRDYTRNQLIKLFKRYPEYQRITHHLEKFVDNYKNVKGLSQKDKRIIGIVLMNKELIAKLNSNTFYQFNNLVGNISKETFKEYFETMTKMYESNALSLEEANIFMNRCVDKLKKVDNDNIPNNEAFSYLYAEKLKDKLDNSLPNANTIYNKRKL